MSTTKIKEIRTAAGISQKALAKEAGVTVYELSKAERGIKELTPDKLDSVAKALNVTAESLQDPAPYKEETPVIAAGTLTAEELELLDLYRSADAEKRQMAIAILKGTMGSRDYVNFLAGMLKSGNSAELLNAVKSMILSSKVEDLLAIAKNLMGKILKLCQLALVEGKELDIDYELLKSKNIHLLGELLTFDGM